MNVVGVAWRISHVGKTRNGYVHAKINIIYLNYNKYYLLYYNSRQVYL